MWRDKAYSWRYAFALVLPDVCSLPPSELDYFHYFFVLANCYSLARTRVGVFPRSSFFVLLFPRLALQLANDSSPPRIVIFDCCILSLGTVRRPCLIRSVPGNYQVASTGSDCGVSPLRMDLGNVGSDHISFPFFLSCQWPRLIIGLGITFSYGTPSRTFFFPRPFPSRATPFTFPSSIFLSVFPR